MDLRGVNPLRQGCLIELPPARLFDLLAEPLPPAGPAAPAQGHLRG